ncbi:MAG: cation-translocating P-type ATPase [Actinomycetota bacterium]
MHQSSATHALDIEAVVGAAGVDPSLGLSEADVVDRRARFGPNELAERETTSRWLLFLEQFRSPLVLLLFGAIAISVLAWALEDEGGLPVDAIVIAVIVLLNAVIGFAQERRADDAVAALRRMTAPEATVVRDGDTVRIPASEVVPGDVLVLAEGDAVAADGRVIESAGLRVAEAALTGESQPVAKTTAAVDADAALGDRVGMVFSGTSVTGGRGRVIVTDTGMESEVGRIATLLEDTEELDTPLQREVDLVGRTLGIAVIVVATVVIATTAALSDVSSVSDLVDVLLIGVSLAVAAVPEGLPAVLSIVLAIGVQRLARRRALVKRLASVETLGSASTICTDKTGTLTKSEMTVVRLVTATGAAALTGSGYDPVGGLVDADGHPRADDREVIRMLGVGARCNDAAIRSVEGRWTAVGDPTEAALLSAFAKVAGGIGLDPTERQGEVPFSSSRKRMTVVIEEEGRHRALTKGAPDVLLDRCTHELVGDEPVLLTAERRARWNDEIDGLAGAALRTMAMAERWLDPDQPIDEEIEHDLVLLGVAGIIDPPRPEVTDAVAEAHAAGIGVVMITGDHPATAREIAAQIGIAAPGSRVVTGPELEAMSDDDLVDAVAEVVVFARVAPEHKLRIVRALQSLDRVVAMTGDGVNDAPALKAADMGIAMGITGTEVSKDAARMILADDDFTTIVAAVREGRAIFHNIQSFLRYLLSSNAGEVLTVFLGVVAAGAIGLRGAGGDEVIAPLLATQILWINLLTDTAPALALGVDRPQDDLMARPPRAGGDRVIDAVMQRGIGLVGLTMAVATLVMLDLGLPGGLIDGDEDLDTARTGAFTVLVLAQLFNALNARSEDRSAFEGLLANPTLWAAIAVSAVLQVLVVHVGFLNDAFGTVPIDAGQWLLATAFASSVLWVAELRKWLRRRS